MKTTDWKFDFSSLPRWNDRETIPFVYDEFWDIPQSDTLCCLYSIAEVSMCNCLGFLAILKNKEDPTLFLNIADGFAFCTNMSVNKAGNLIFLQPSIHNKDANVIQRPLLIVDVNKNVFSYVTTENFNPCYRVVELNENVFKVEADAHQKKHDKCLAALSRKKIRINRLKWHDLMQIHALPEMLFGVTEPFSSGD